MKAGGSLLDVHIFRVQIAIKPRFVTTAKKRAMNIVKVNRVLRRRTVTDFLCPPPGGKTTFPRAARGTHQNYVLLGCADRTYTATSQATALLLSSRSCSKRKDGPVAKRKCKRVWPTGARAGQIIHLRFPLSLGTKD